MDNTLLRSAHHHNDLMRLCVASHRQHVAVQRLPVYRDGFHTLHHAVGIAHRDLIDIAAELSRYDKTVPLGGNARVDLQPVKLRLDAQDILGDRIQRPGGGAGQPEFFASP